MHFSPGFPTVLPHPDSKGVAHPYSLDDDERKSLPKPLLSRLWKDDSGPTLAILCQDDIEHAFRMFLNGLGPSGRHARDPLAGLPTTRRSSSTGTLSRIWEMPLEIAFEIMSYLHPEDLLSLSRTSRHLREILWSESSRFVWRTSLASVRGLPACPLDMVEPQFANLVFGQHCQFCGKSGVKDIYWTCRVRCCGSCVKTHFISDEQLETLIPEDLKLEKFSSVFPYIVVNRYHPQAPSRISFHHSIALRYLKELEALTASDVPAEAIGFWVKEKKASQIARIKHASLCEHWYGHWLARTSPPDSELPFFDLAVTAVLSSALVYLWKDKIFG